MHKWTNSSTSFTPVCRRMIEVCDWKSVWSSIWHDMTAQSAHQRYASWTPNLFVSFESIVEMVNKNCFFFIVYHCTKAAKCILVVVVCERIMFHREHSTRTLWSSWLNDDWLECVYALTMLTCVFVCVLFYILIFFFIRLHCCSRCVPRQNDRRRRSAVTYTTTFLFILPCGVCSALTNHWHGNEIANWNRVAPLELAYYVHIFIKCLFALLGFSMIMWK